MILSGKDILKRLGKSIVIKPFEEKRLNPNSYNLRLHDELLVYENGVLDMKRENPARKVKIPAEGMILRPGKLYLGRTLEYTETHGLVPMLEGRSSVGRLGLCIHATAGFGDVGFRGYWTLEMFCVHPIRVYPFVEVCQICYHKIEGEHVPYSSAKYQDNRGIQASRMHMDFEKAETNLNPRPE